MSITGVITRGISDNQIARGPRLEDPQSSGSASFSDTYDFRVEPSWLEKTISYIESLRHLQSDWDSEGSPRPADGIIESAKAFACNYIARLKVEGPNVEPTRVGGVLFSWQKLEHDLEVDFATPRVVTFVYLNHKTGEIESGILCDDDLPKSGDRTVFQRVLDRFFSQVN